MSTIAPSVLHEPGSPAYEDACVLFNAMITTRPRSVARCSTPDDVARRSPLPRPRASRCPCAPADAVTGRALCEGVVLDVRGIDFVEVDPQRRVARIGGGNVGVVTALETLHPVGPEVLAGIVLPRGGASSTPRRGRPSCCAPSAT